MQIAKHNFLRVKPFFLMINDRIHPLNLYMIIINYIGFFFFDI